MEINRYSVSTTSGHVKNKFSNFTDVDGFHIVETRICVYVAVARVYSAA